MFLANTHADHRRALEPADAAVLDARAATEALELLAHRPGHRPTPLLALPALAAANGVAAIHAKYEGDRLGLGSFKALGGAHAVVRLVLEAAGDRLGRTVGIDEIETAAVRAVATGLTFACATDGNHGRSVAQGAELVGARAVVFVHGHVSEGRIAAIAAFGAEIVRVPGSYDESVAEAARVAVREGWTLVSDTSWPGYERIPGLVMQGYTALVAEALAELPAAPTHVFVQCGVGGIAAAVAGHLAQVFGAARPTFVVVDPARAPCMFETARAGHPVKLAPDEPTVMAMLDCFEPSLVAWRVLARAADGFMTVDEDEAVAVMRRLVHPLPGDPRIVAGESGGVGLAGFLQAAGDPAIRGALGLDADARVLVVITEGATDPVRWAEVMGEPVPGD